MWTADRRRSAWVRVSRALAGVAATAALAGATAAHAASLADGFYRLLNHPDGAAAPPLYGLRLDGLIGPDISSIFTFSFEGNGAHMQMEFLLEGAKGTVHIFGKAFGGKDVGDSYENPVLWDIDFNYKIEAAPSSDPDLIAI